MEKYTDKIRNIYQETLALDTIYNILSWHDRTMLHKILLGEIMEDELSPKATILCKYVDLIKWQSPYMKYGQDRFLYFYDENTEKDYPIENYQTLHIVTTNELNNLLTQNLTTL